MKKDARKLRPKVLYNFMYEDKDKKSDVINRMTEVLKISKRQAEASIALAMVLGLIKEKNGYLIARVSKELI